MKTFLFYFIYVIGMRMAIIYILIPIELTYKNVIRKMMEILV